MLASRRYRGNAGAFPAEAVRHPACTPPSSTPSVGRFCVSLPWAASPQSRKSGLIVRRMPSPCLHFPTDRPVPTASVQQMCQGRHDIATARHALRHSFEVRVGSGPLLVPIHDFSDGPYPLPIGRGAGRPIGPSRDWSRHGRLASASRRFSRRIVAALLGPSHRISSALPARAQTGEPYSMVRARGRQLLMWCQSSGRFRCPCSAPSIAVGFFWRSPGPGPECQAVRFLISRRGAPAER